MRWYVNDLSLQNQFADPNIFEGILRQLLSARSVFEQLRVNVRTTRALPERLVRPGLTVRGAIQASRDRDFRGAILAWLDRTGPFVDDERLPEVDDYFECFGLDATDSGLGEAARRIKSGQLASTFSFEGGFPSFETTPLTVHHGLPEERLGRHHLENIWNVETLRRSAQDVAPPINSWRGLIEAARQRFPHISISDGVYQNTTLAREPFDGVIRDRTLTLLGVLNDYMVSRGDAGAETPAARSIVEKFFIGERALFSGESPTNQRVFARELAFVDPDNDTRTIFAHWHGKISHRFFRLHFEWPVPPATRKLKVLYLGPKLTKG